MNIYSKLWILELKLFDIRNQDIFRFYKANPGGGMENAVEGNRGEGELNDTSGRKTVLECKAVYE